MSGVRYDRILASTALALIFAAPIGEARSQDVRITAQATAFAAVTAPSRKPATEELKPAVEDTGAVNLPDEPKVSTPSQVAPAAPSDSSAVVAPDPLASLDPADRVIAEKVRDLLAAKNDRIFASKKERSAVEAFYQSRNLAPLWFDKGVEAARTSAVIARLKAADADGLDASDYKVPNFINLSGADAQAEAELKLTQVVLTYARHVQAGRFPYTRVTTNAELPQAPPVAGDVLAKISDASDAALALDQFSPPHEAYQKLKAALAEMRGKTEGGRKQIADGPLLKLVAKHPMEDARVPMLRERLGVAGDPSDLRYDAKLADAVKKFQKANELPTTGNLDGRTIKEINGPAKSQQIDLILANMERWRWYPRDLGKAYSMVNQPDFTLKVVKDGGTVWSTRIVIGKPGDQATPLLTDTMKHITVNPTWNVPPSIVNNEYLPMLAQDPTILARMGLKVSYNRDGGVHISQPPGEKNALGRIRFNFPNRFLVYQHDTQDRHLFAHDVRAYSHGCMRVQDPAKYAEVILSIGRPQDGYTEDRIKKMYGSAETDIQFSTPVPVHLTYQSAFVDDGGKLQFRRDVYAIDSRTIAALKSERAMVDPKEERAREVASSTSSRRQVRSVSFFESLFGGGYRPSPPRRVTR
jgi:murein L,D-transpeptidase YcbB/YkuD